MTEHDSSGAQTTNGTSTASSTAPAAPPNPPAQSTNAAPAPGSQVEGSMNGAARSGEYHWSLTACPGLCRRANAEAGGATDGGRRTTQLSLSPKRHATAWQTTELIKATQDPRLARPRPPKRSASLGLDHLRPVDAPFNLAVRQRSLGASRVGC